MDEQEDHDDIPVFHADALPEENEEETFFAAVTRARDEQTNMRRRFMSSETF
jgi:hypothetical protein